ETYTAVEVDGEALVVARALAPAFLELPGVKGRGVLAALEVSGVDPAGTVCRHPFIDRDAPVVAADWVAMDAGTGLVHIAPGHGEEDYELGKQGRPPIYTTDDDDGRFIDEVAHFAGLPVWDANPKIVEHLKRTGAL